MGRTMVVEYIKVLNGASQSVLEKVHKREMSMSAAHKSLKGMPEYPNKEKVAKIVKDNTQIMKLSKKQIKMFGFYIIELGAA